MFSKKIIACGLATLLSIHSTLPTAGNIARFALANACFLIVQQKDIKKKYPIEHDLKFLGLAGIINQTAAIATQKAYPEASEGLTRAFDITAGLYLIYKAGLYIAHKMEWKKEANTLEEKQKQLTNFGYLCGAFGTIKGIYFLLLSYNIPIPYFKSSQSLIFIYKEFSCF